MAWALRYDAGVAKEARKIQRAAARDGASDGKSKKKALTQPVVGKPAAMPDPLGKEQLKQLLVRLGIPIAGVWLIGILIWSVSYSTTAKSLALGLPALVTLLAAGLVFWIVRQAQASARRRQHSQQGRDGRRPQGCARRARDVVQEK